MVLPEGAFEWIGTGKPLVLLHGWGKSKEALRPLAELLAWNRRVGLIDLPGFGATPPPDQPWGTADYMEWVAQRLDGPCDVLGHSLGARIALRLAHRHPDQVRRLVLIGAAGLRPRSLKRRVRLAAARCIRTAVRLLDRTGATRLEEGWYRPRFGSRDYQQAGLLRPTLVRVVNEDLAPLLPQIQQGALLLWGRLDSETPPEMGERMQAALPASRLIWLDGKGHEPHEGVGAQLCAHLIDQYLDDLHAR
jgi:pimeloyl-ACP methyl ester carboxylesterase